MNGIRGATEEVVLANTAIEQQLGEVQQQTDRIRATIEEQQVQVGTIASAIDETALTARQMADNIVTVDDQNRMLGDATAKVSATFAQVRDLIERLEVESEAVLHAQAA